MISELRTGEPEFPRIKRERIAMIDTTATNALVVPWGPFLDVYVDPMESALPQGGVVSIYADTNGMRALLVSLTVSMPGPVRISTSAACDEYVITARLPGSARPRSVHFVGIAYGASR